MIPPAQVELLRQFVRVLQVNPALLHMPEIAFFRDYLTSLGAKIPDPPAPKAEEKREEPMEEQSGEETKEEEEIPEIPKPELDESGVLTEKNENDKPLPMGDSSKEVTEEMMEQSNEKRNEALEKFSDGDWESAVKVFTEAIELNPHSAILHAKRAAALLKLERPHAAVADCDKAIKLNPDAAAGYKFRGRAHRLLGHWEKAHSDLATACKLDYDDTANEWLKEVEPNAKKLQEWHRAKRLVAEERELKERKERVRKAQEARAKAQAEAEAAGDDADDGPMGGPGGIPPGMAAMFNDPEVAELLKDPTVTKAFEEIMQNPANMMKHLSNPKVAKLMSKFTSGGGGGGLGGLFGGGGMPFGGAPGAGADAGAGCTKPSTAADSGCCGGGTCGDGGAKSRPMAPDPDVD